MRTAAVAFATATLSAGVLTPAIRKVAVRRRWFDHALSSRKIHGKPIPRLGGVAIVLGFYAPLVALFFVASGVGEQFYAEPRRALGLFVGGLAIAALGLYDDFKGANAKLKFLVQFGVAGFMYAAGFRIDQIANPFGPHVVLGPFGLPFTLFWIAGVINALNLIDGLDGLAGGVALAAIATTFTMAAIYGMPLMVLFTAALGGAVLGFLVYNFNPATIFMGDTGSMFLGFVLATTAIQTHQKSSTAVAIVVPIIALGLPISDTLLAMGRRAARGAPLFSADRGHIHHKLLDLGLSQRQAVLALYGASVVLGLAALATAFASASSAMFLLLALAGIIYIALRRLGYLDIRRAQRLFEERRRNLEIRAAVRRTGELIRRAHGSEAVWQALRRVAPTLGASAVAVHFVRFGVSYKDGFDDRNVQTFRARYALHPERPGEDFLEFGWADGRSAVERDTEIAVELLCEQLSFALEHLELANETAESNEKVVDLAG